MKQPMLFSSSVCLLASNSAEIRHLLFRNNYLQAVTASMLHSPRWNNFHLIVMRSIAHKTSSYQLLPTTTTNNRSIEDRSSLRANKQTWEPNLIDGRVLALLLFYYHSNTGSKLCWTILIVTTSIAIKLGGERGNKLTWGSARLLEVIKIVSFLTGSYII